MRLSARRGRRHPRATVGDLEDALLFELLQEIDEQEGIAVHDAGQGQHVRLGLGPEDVGDDIRHRSLVQRPQPDPDRAVTFQQVEQTVEAGTVAAAGRTGQHPDERIGGEVSGHRPQRQQGDRISPVQVVQRQEHRFPGHPPLQLFLQVLHQQQPLISMTADVHLSGHGQRMARFPERRGERGEGDQLGKFVRRALSDA
ncbi:hypothetical protein [Microbispora rosea]|uniref:hypothetical protein n=1 Tax=Microbispora rosea TaxID=58117 RepID=UPI00342D1736